PRRLEKCRRNPMIGAISGFRMRWLARGRPYAINHMGICMSDKKTDLPNGESESVVSDTAAPDNEARPEPADAAAQQADSEASVDEVAALREALNQMSDEADRYRDQALRAV